MTDECICCEFYQLCLEGVGPVICPYGVMQEENECSDDW